jgi:CheY-like chemotaxis protein
LNGFEIVVEALFTNKPVACGGEGKITDVMEPLNGPALVRTMRHPSSGPLALVPVIIMTAHAKPALVTEALRSGVHQVLALPTSAITLARRLDRLLNDDRPFEL